MNETVIKLENVSKYYKLYESTQGRLKEALHPLKKKYHKKHHVLNNLNLEVKRGEVLGIVGRNGCGKSTLLKLITGVLTPENGKIIVKGKITALLELGSGFNPEFTGLENIRFYTRISGLSDSEIDAVIDDIIVFADIGEYIKQPLKNYSSGMKARLGFAVAVHISPDILILDEVLSVGDALFRRKCYAKMEEFFKGGKTILYVSHDSNSVNELCTRAIFLEDGEIVVDGDAKTVSTFYQKRLFSKNYNAEAIKKEVLNMVNQNAILNNNKLLKKNNESIEKDDYIKGFEISPTNVNQSLAKIGNVTIVNDEDEIVNYLVSKKNYKIKYTAIFNIDMEGVSFGVQIQTNKGVVISGVNMKDYAHDVITFVKKNEQYELIVEFKCNLLPGVYIVKAFISNKTNEAIIKNDAYMFKVKALPYKQGGYITLNQKLSINKIHKN